MESASAPEDVPSASVSNTSGDDAGRNRDTPVLGDIDGVGETGDSVAPSKGQCSLEDCYCMNEEELKAAIKKYILAVKKAAQYRARLCPFTRREVDLQLKFPFDFEEVEEEVSEEECASDTVSEALALKTPEENREVSGSHKEKELGGSAENLEIKEDEETGTDARRDSKKKLGKGQGRRMVAETPQGTGMTTRSRSKRAVPASEKCKWAEERGKEEAPVAISAVEGPSSRGSDEVVTDAQNDPGEASNQIGNGITEQSEFQWPKKGSVLEKACVEMKARKNAGEKKNSTAIEIAAMLPPPASELDTEYDSSEDVSKAPEAPLQDVGSIPVCSPRPARQQSPLAPKMGGIKRRPMPRRAPHDVASAHYDPRRSREAGRRGHNTPGRYYERSGGNREGYGGNRPQRRSGHLPPYRKSSHGGYVSTTRHHPRRGHHFEGSRSQGRRPAPRSLEDERFPRSRTRSPEREDRDRPLRKAPHRDYQKDKSS